MPQLKGPEKKRLKSLLKEHLDQSRLNQALDFNSLGNLEERAGNVNFDQQTYTVVDQLSQEYKIPQLVEGALRQLNNSCPPLEQWWEDHQELLERRRRNDAKIRYIKDAAYGPVGWILFGGGVVICLAVFYLIQSGWPWSTNEVRWQRLNAGGYTTEPAVRHQLTQFLAPDMPPNEDKSIGFRLIPGGNSFPRHWELAKMWEDRFRIGTAWDERDGTWVVSQVGTSSEFPEHVTSPPYHLILVFFPRDREAHLLIEQQPPESFLNHAP